MASAISIRPATTRDAAAIAAIYNPYITGTIVSFEESEVPNAEMTRRIEATRAAQMPWVVAEIGDAVVGYAYATRWRERASYRHAAELAVYVDGDRSRQGIGSALIPALLDRLRAMGTHTVIAGIALPNPGSVALHEKFGFRKVAHFEEVGRKFDEWVDVGYWEVIL